MADWNSRQSPVRPNNRGKFEPHPDPPFSGAVYSSKTSTGSDNSGPGSPAGQAMEQGASQYAGVNGAPLLGRLTAEQCAMLLNLNFPNQQQTEPVGSMTFARNVFYNTGNHAPLSPANQLMGMMPAIGEDQGAHQQASARISGSPIWTNVTAQQLEMLKGRSTDQNNDKLQDPTQMSPVNVPSRRGRPRKNPKPAEEATGAAKKQKVQLQDLPFEALGQRMDEKIKEMNMAYEKRIGELEKKEKAVGYRLLALEYYEKKSHEDDLKIKKLEDSNGKLVDAIKDLGEKVTSMMDTLEENLSNKMNGLVKKTKAVEEVFKQLSGEMANQKQAQKDEK